MRLKVDIIIPVYNEGDKILSSLDALKRDLKSGFRVLICYDQDNDNTLDAIKGYQGIELVKVKNKGKGAHGAIMTGFEASTAPSVIVLPADDDYNTTAIDRMVNKFETEDCQIVCASRFVPGGTMEGCPWLKATLVRVSAFVLFHFARLPTRDASNGFRLFSRQILREIAIESTEGFTYSIELLVKAHRFGYKIGEVPAKWFERRTGPSRFKVIKWLPGYLRWFFYAFRTPFCRLLRIGLANER